MMYERAVRATSNPNIKNERLRDSFPNFKIRFMPFKQNSTYAEVLKELFQLEGDALLEAIDFERIRVRGPGKLMCSDVEPGTGNAGLKGEKYVWSRDDLYEIVLLDDLQKCCGQGKTFEYVVDESLTMIQKY